MKEETPIGGFHNRLQSYGFQREFLKRHGGTEEGQIPSGMARGVDERHGAAASCSFHPRAGALATPGGARGLQGTRSQLAGRPAGSGLTRRGLGEDGGVDGWQGWQGWQKHLPTPTRPSIRWRGGGRFYWFDYPGLHSRSSFSLGYTIAPLTGLGKQHHLPKKYFNYFGPGTADVHHPLATWCVMKVVMTALAAPPKAPQTSQSAESRVSKPAGGWTCLARRAIWHPADLEIGDTAGLCRRAGCGTPAQAASRT